MEEYRVLKSYSERKVFDEIFQLEQFRIICAEVDDDGNVLNWEAEFLINPAEDKVGSKQYDRLRYVLENVSEAFKKPVLVHSDDESFDLGEVEDNDD